MSNLTKQIYVETVAYLKSIGVKIPKHEVFFKEGYSGSYVTRSRYEIKLVLGKYVTHKICKRFVMHELIHVIAARKKLPVIFSRQQSISENLPLQILSGIPDCFRPCGYASWYAKLSNGEEALAELLGYIYSKGNFGEVDIPEDLNTEYNKAINWLKK